MNNTASDKVQLENLRDNDIGTYSAWLPMLGNNAQSMTHVI